MGKLTKKAVLKKEKKIVWELKIPAQGMKFKKFSMLQ